MATDILDQMSHYKFIYFGFDPAGESSTNLWKAIPVLSGSNDAINWVVIAEFPQLGNLRDGNIAKYKDYYWITGTTGLYRTKNFNGFKEFDTSFLQRDGYKDVWAPEFFTDYSGDWHIVWGAVSDSRHIYVADFDPATGEVTNAWQPVDEDHGMDPHIWKMNGKYYLSIDAYWLYESDSYLGPFTIIKNNIQHSNESKSVWYEAGETLIDGDTIYFYCDHITGSVPGVADSGEMLVQSANVNDLSNWTGPQAVVSTINMRHGSFLNMQEVTNAEVTSVKMKQIGEYEQIVSVSKANYRQAINALSTIYKKIGVLVGDNYSFNPPQLSLPDVGFNRALWLYIVHSFDTIKLYLDQVIGIFRSNGLANIRTKKDFEDVKITRPTSLLIDTHYQNVLNDNWAQIEMALNDLLNVLKKFHMMKEDK
ncbi:hypothetical protein [Limosilactobacillus kribbianus]|uniref:hypothetical protein n=1 Tax=Limosilactobacillus kribbianus TaxID=2982695 RepID=UPI002264ED03|nr:hypothetical protein [Limosilactobacillus kribbianus]